MLVMNLPIVYQPHAVSDDSTKSFMLFMADAWVKMQPKKLTLADMDEYWNFGRDDEVMRAGRRYRGGGRRDDSIDGQDPSVAASIL